MAVRNIDIVLGGLADAMRGRDPERIAEFLGPDLVWEGLEPGLRCDGRQQAMSVIRNRFAAAPFTVEAIEAIDAGQHVIVGLRGPGFNGTPGDLQTVGQIFNVFTFSDGKVVRWRDFLTRREALAAANAKDQPWQLKHRAGPAGQRPLLDPDFGTGGGAPGPFARRSGEEPRRTMALR